jgi:glyoxylase-like metal-dependent hydrolase (beta-lactamase superfamily II)
MSSNPREIADGVLFLRTLIANVYLIREGASWVLIDAGVHGYADTIRDAAREFLGSIAPPAAIVLTHGHFDHVGALPALLDTWDVPVFAHPLERPYLTGRSPYPPPDPLVGGGMMTLLSKLYPRGPIDLGSRLEFLSDSRLTPGLVEWQWIPTPGHTAGHVSLYRARDRVLIAGDAVTTVRQESMIAVATQRPELHGPPAYYTQDWIAAAKSVATLAALEPDILATGHGEPQNGPAVRTELRQLAHGFAQREVPRYGRYTRQPALTDENGIVMLPADPLPKLAAGLAIVAGVAVGLSLFRQRQIASS